MNELKEIVTERPMSFARAFHILTVWMKKDLICGCLTFFGNK